jgi:GrpB-like predicted nucleotidyltransferase (UPF0157 family)
MRMQPGFLAHPKGSEKYKQMESTYHQELTAWRSRYVEEREPSVSSDTAQKN